METQILHIARLIAQHAGLQVHTARMLGKGMCNNAWLVDTADGGRYILKTARTAPEETEQNDLFTEATLLQQIRERNPALPVPQVLFALRQPMLYVYPYIPGTWMRTAWPAMRENTRLEVCTGIARLHHHLNSLFGAAECRAIGLSINLDAGLDAETRTDLATVLADPKLPANLRAFAARCHQAFQATQPLAQFAFCHNDSHHENLLLHNETLCGLVDFGDADYGDIHREFGRYALDYPQYFETIVRQYEIISGRQLSRTRIIARAFLEALEEIAYEYAVRDRQKTILQFERLWKQYADTTP